MEETESEEKERTQSRTRNKPSDTLADLFILLSYFNYILFQDSFRLNRIEFNWLINFMKTDIHIKDQNSNKIAKKKGNLIYN